MKATVAPFSCDVTPPVGHPLCGGWITPVKTVADPLEARGFVYLGQESPWVFCVLDWVGLRNEAHERFQKALAKAAGTSPEKVWVHCVHPHDAPFADVGAQRYLDSVHGPSSLDLGFFDSVLSKTARALEDGLRKPQRVDHLALGKADVANVASARRILGPQGKVAKTRTSFTKDEEAKNAPTGLIDPALNLLAFLQGDKPVLAIHNYATHPMSRYGDGNVSADFTGLARRNFEAKTGIFTLYTTGCAGNITAGKFNDGTPQARQTLSKNMENAMLLAWNQARRIPLESPIFRHQPIPFSPRSEPSFSADSSRKTLENPNAAKAARGNAAFQLAWLDRIQRPVHAASVDFGQVVWLSLPGEPFIEYQLLARQLGGDRFTMVSGYGDGGPGYIPTDEAFAQGGYEPTVALAAPSEPIMKRTIARLLGR